MGNTPSHLLHSLNCLQRTTFFALKFFQVQECLATILLYSSHASSVICSAVQNFSYFRENRLCHNKRFLFIIFFTHSYSQKLCLHPDEACCFHHTIQNISESVFLTSLSHRATEYGTGYSCPKGWTGE